MTGQACGWQDRQLPSSSFISTPAVSPTAATVGRSARLSSLGFLLPSTVLRLVFLLRWPIWWLEFLFFSSASGGWRGLLVR
ncbi:hypothetical protein NC651_038664 [Populus alba x Populus x berolinensis]|nr:hypothetical protein NC651_038664 [Populus alba x Populus x berolinensis]